MRGLIKHVWFEDVRIREGVWTRDWSGRCRDSLGERIRVFLVELFLVEAAQLQPRLKPVLALLQTHLGMVGARLLKELSLSP